MSGMLLGLQIIITGEFKMSVSRARIQCGRSGGALFLSPAQKIGHVVRLLLCPRRPLPRCRSVLLHYGDYVWLAADGAALRSAALWRLLRGLVVAGVVGLPNRTSKVASAAPTAAPIPIAAAGCDAARR